MRRTRPIRPGSLVSRGESAEKRRLARLTLAAALGEPALPQSASVVFRVSAPDACFLVGLQCVLEAGLLHGACAANDSGLLYLVDRWTGTAYWEEQIRIRVATSRKLPPRGECQHDALLALWYRRTIVNAFTRASEEHTRAFRPRARGFGQFLGTFQVMAQDGDADAAFCAIRATECGRFGRDRGQAGPSITTP